jgi:hypothetical protein
MVASRPFRPTAIGAACAMEQARSPQEESSTKRPPPSDSPVNADRHLFLLK